MILYLFLTLFTVAMFSTLAMSIVCIASCADKRIAEMNFVSSGGESRPARNVDALGHGCGVMEDAQ